jgi:hypothetical protein
MTDWTNIGSVEKKILLSLSLALKNAWWDLKDMQSYTM